MPHVLYYGRLEKDNIMVMELLGPSIEDLFRLCQRRFSMKTICMIAKQLVNIEYIYFFNYNKNTFIYIKV